MENYISIIDLGTGSIRNTIYNLSGELITFIQKENPIYHPKPGWTEQNPILWWQLLKETFLELSSEIKANIIGLSVTSQREGIVPVNSKFEPLSNIIIWLDGRTEKEAEEIENTLGKDTIYDICGLIPNPAWSLSKILWIKKNQAAIYSKTHFFLQAEDYIISRLSGKAVSEFSIASRTCMLDVRNKKWSNTILDAFDINKNLLPELYEPGSFIANITKEIATEFGLPSKINIYCGAGDQQAAALGVGAIKEGVLSTGIGTSSAISMTINNAIPDKNKSIILNCAAIPGKWEYEPPIWNTGGLVKWFYEKINNEAETYEELLQKTKKISHGSDGLICIPYFSGAGSPRWNPSLKGGFLEVDLSHSKYHFLRAILESIAYEIRYNVEFIQKSGIKADKIILSGGASKNLLLCQIISDVMQIPIEIFNETEASSKGVFYLIKSSIEKTKLDDLVNNSVNKNTKIFPNTKMAKDYTTYYSRYIQMGNFLETNTNH